MLLYNSVENKTLLYNTVFRKKDLFASGTELTIITGYIGFSTPEELLNLGFEKIKVIIGMYGSGVSPELHSILLRIQEKDNRIKFFYTNGKIHSKIYIWHKNDDIKQYAIGSANFSLATALVENLYRETLELFDNEIEINKVYINKYLKDIESFLIPIDRYTSTLREEQKVPHITLEQMGRSLSLLSTKSTPNLNIVGLSTIKGDVSVASGINWGFSNGLPLLGDAYIAVSSEFIKNNSDIISPKPDEDNIPIEVLWDDKETMLMLMEGNYEMEDSLYPKQISSYNNKSILGIYLRKRIGEKINKDLLFTQEEIDEIRRFKKFKNSNEPVEIKKEIFESIKSKVITRDMLELYGRTTIDIKKMDNGGYYFDFSVKKND